MMHYVVKRIYFSYTQKSIIYYNIHIIINNNNSLIIVFIIIQMIIDNITSPSRYFYHNSGCLENFYTEPKVVNFGGNGSYNVRMPAMDVEELLTPNYSKYKTTTGHSSRLVNKMITYLFKFNLYLLLWCIIK